MPLAPAPCFDGQRFQVRPEVEMYPFAHEVVLIDSQNDTMYTINHTGARIWTLLVEGHSGPSISETLSREFPVERDQLDAEIQEFLTSLLQARLVHIL